MQEKASAATSPPFMAALEYFAFLNLASRQQTPKPWLTRNVMLQERKQGATLCPWSLQGWPGSLLHPKASMLAVQAWKPTLQGCLLGTGQSQVP